MILYSLELFLNFNSETMKTIILNTVFLIVFLPGFAQKLTKEETDFLKTNHFDQGFIAPAKKKISTVILKDGKELQGNAEKVKYKKNHIQSLTLKEESGQKTDLTSGMIQEAYFAPSGMEKFSKKSNEATRVKTRKTSKPLNGDEAHFLNLTVGLQNKKKKDDFLLMLVNPDFDGLIEVYFDPAAKESKGADVGAGIGSALGVKGLGGAFKIGGGMMESYYIKKGDRTFWLRKKDFKKEYDFLFGDNQEFMERYPYKNVKWNWLSGLILEYTKMTGKDTASN